MKNLPWKLEFWFLCLHSDIEYAIDPDNLNPHYLKLFFVTLQSSNYWSSTLHVHEYRVFSG